MKLPMLNSKKLSFRAWISLGTFALIILMLFITRHELEKAWDLMIRVDMRILALFVPIVLLNYYAAGEMIFSYLRAKGKIGHISPLEQIRMSLEMNFVNHIMPSGGASGLTYMTLRLKRYGVSASKATMAQVVRMFVGFAAFSMLLVVSVLLITLDGSVNRAIILVSSTLVSIMVGVSLAGMYFLNKQSRVRKSAKWLTATINQIVRKVTFGRKRAVVERQKVTDFLLEMHEDMTDLKQDGRILRRPFFWANVFVLTDVGMFFVTFWALGSIVNPAPILIAYGLAALAGFAVVTPGGSGAYEALMVGFLTISGINQGTAIAGVLLTRVLILVVILAIGYVFYQNAVNKYTVKPR